MIVPRKEKRNVVIISEAEYNELEEAKMNAVCSPCKKVHMPCWNFSKLLKKHQSRQNTFFLEAGFLLRAPYTPLRKSDMM